MAIAAIAHAYVFSAEPYHFLPMPDYGEVTAQMTESTSKFVNNEGKTGVLDEKETKIEAPGTSITESVQDVILTGGEHVRFLISSTPTQYQSIQSLISAA